MFFACYRKGENIISIFAGILQTKIRQLEPNATKSERPENFFFDREGFSDKLLFAVLTFLAAVFYAKDSA